LLSSLLPTCRPLRAGVGSCQGVRQGCSLPVWQQRHHQLWAAGLHARPNRGAHCCCCCCCFGNSLFATSKSLDVHLQLLLLSPTGLRIMHQRTAG
jgi:hypothetical protein